jgi:U-box domain
MTAQLQSRFPGVEFVGEMTSITFIGDVTICPGARIDLSREVRLRGSTIGRDAIIEGGCIKGCIIEGRVSGGRIEDSYVGVFARISGGTLQRCTVQGHGQVGSGCTLQDTTVTDDTQISGGQACDSEISGNSRVTGGFLVRSIVQDDALVTGGQAFDSLISKHGRLSHGRIVEAQIDGNPLGLRPTGLGEVSPRQDVSIAQARARSPPGTTVSRLSEQLSNCQPPDFLVDKLTGDLIIQAACTPDGETYDQSTLRRLAATHGRCYHNRAVQAVSDQWRHFAAACNLIRMRGHINDPLFPLPQFIDPITSQPIVAAVLCPCGQTYDRSSIERYIQQQHSCPMAGHPLRREDLYVNRTIQRMIAVRKAQ